MQRGKFDIRQDVFHIPDHLSVSLGLRWDFIGARPVDLDASGVAFNEDGKCLEVVFFNNLKSKGEYMVHSGDNQTGENDADDDENIMFEMSKIPQEVSYIMVCVTSYTGIDFTVVEQATCRLVNRATKQKVHEFSLGVIGSHTGTLLCAFSRTQVPNGDHMETFWAMREINIPCEGYTFVDVLPKMLDLLAVQDSDREACLVDLPDYSLVKDGPNMNVTPSQLKMGLGWDGENDLDAALVMLSETGEYVDHVHAKHGKLRSRDLAVAHSGDKLTGYDVQGDDEFMTVNLNMIDKRAAKVFFVVLLFDGFAKSLGAVPHGYVRMQNRAPTETQYRDVNRFDLPMCGSATAFVFSMAYREGTSAWSYVSINESIAEGRDWIDVFPHIRCYAKYFSQGPEVWAAWRDVAYVPFHVEVCFLEARGVGPLEPHHFAAHCEAWVCDKKGRGRFKTSICCDRDHIKWEDTTIFKLLPLDRLRVMFYEHAVVGHVDLDMAELEGLRGGTEINEWFPLQGVDIEGDLKLRVRLISAEEAARRQPVTEPTSSWCVVS